MMIDKRHIHIFACATMKKFNFASRVTLNNKTEKTYSVDVTVYSDDGIELGSASELGFLRPEKALFFELEELEKRSGVSTTQDLMFVFSLIPEALIDLPDLVEVNPKEILTDLSAQDHYIEHYDRATGFSSGVLYITPGMNNPMLPATFTFLLQAPKVFLSDHRNTIFQFLYVCAGPSLITHADLHCKLRKEDGTALVTWTEPVPAKGVRNIDVKKQLAKAGVDFHTATNRHGFLFFEAYSHHAGFISLTMNMNSLKGTFDFEHTLPPAYYNIGIDSDVRRTTINHYRETYTQ